MKLAHVVIVSPKRCGLAETTREIVAAERALGHDARMFDPAPTVFHPKGDEDRGARIERDRAWLNEADVIIDHSGCDGTTDGLNKPHILVAHGRPRHSFIGELRGEAPVYHYHRRIDADPRYKAVVTFWPEHVPYHQVIFKQTPVHYVQACVDLKAWTPEGPKVDVFNGKGGKYNVVLTDVWRDDGDLFDPINAVALAARQLPGIKLHIFGVRDEIGGRGWKHLFNVLQEDGTLGHVQGWAADLGHVYRAADLLVTPHSILTRAVREAWACGCESHQTTSDLSYDVYQITEALQWPKQKAMVRKLAEDTLNPLESAKQLIAVAEAACS